MGVVYTVPIENVTIGTAVQDIFSVLPGATHSVAIHHIHLEASVSAEAGVAHALKARHGDGDTGLGRHERHPGGGALWHDRTCRADNPYQRYVPDHDDGRVHHARRVFLGRRAAV